jgi:hypothetical protein
MKRTLIRIGLLLSVVGPSGGLPVAPLSYSRGRIADARDFGLVDGGDAWGPITAALRSIRERVGVAPGAGNPATNRGVVFIPSGKYTLSRPVILDTDHVFLVGEGADLTELSPADYFPAVVVARLSTDWKDRNEFKSIPVSFPADHRVDSFGVLDTSIAPIPDRSWGFALKSPSNAGPWADCFLSSSSAPAFGRDDLWRSATALSVDWCMTGPDGGPTSGDAMFGMGDRNGPMPFYVDTMYEPAVDRRLFVVHFSTARGSYWVANNPPRTFAFGDPNAVRGPVRLTFQIAFDRNADGSNGDASPCEIRAWQDGAEVPIRRGWGTSKLKSTTAEPSFTAADHLRFSPNRLLPFTVGNPSGYENTWQVAPERRTVATFHGLRIGVDAPYTSDVGNKQVRIDNGRIDDDYRYRGGGGRDPSSLVARYVMEDRGWDGGAGDWGRFVRFQRGPYAGTTSTMAIAQHERGDVRSANVEGTGLRDLTISCSPLHPTAVLLGPLIGFDVRGCSLGGGQCGIQGMNVGANYPIRITESNLSGWLAWYHGISQIVRIDRLGPGYVTNHAIVTSGSDFEVGEIATGGYSDTRTDPSTFYWSDYSSYAGHLAIGATNIDEENGAASAIVVEKPAVGMDVTIGRVGAGGQSPDVASVRLIDHTPDDGKGGTGGRGYGIVSIRGLTARSGLGLWVQGDWSGTIEGTDRAWSGVPGSCLIRYGDRRPSVVSIHHLPDVPNRLPGAVGTAWTAGAHLIRRTGAKSGDWTEATCLTSGTVGTATPPRWQTFDVIP